MSPQVSETARTDSRRTPEQAGAESDAPGASARFLTGLTAAGAAVVAATLLAEPGAEAGTAPWMLVAMLGLALFLVSTVGFATAAWGAAGRRRRLARIGGLTGIAAVVAVAVAVGMRLFLPLPLQPVFIQFSDLAGRVQIEYCPTLPQSFEGRMTAADLNSTNAVVPVKVTGGACGSEDFSNGVWLYLARSSITIGAE